MVKRGSGGSTKGFNITRRHKSWTVSKLAEHDGCAAKAAFKHIDKLPDPGGPAMERGSGVHGCCEAYIAGRTAKLPSTIKVFAETEQLVWNAPTKKELARHRKAYSKGRARVELELAFRKDWTPCAWLAPDVYVRFKIDAVLYDAKKGWVEITDWKTGKFKPEGDFDEQLLGYCVGVLAADKHKPIFGTPLRGAKAKLWFTDAGEAVTRDIANVPVEALAQHTKYFDKRAKAFLEDVIHAATPGLSCKWCPYSVNKGGVCKF